MTSLTIPHFSPVQRFTIGILCLLIVLTLFHPLLAQPRATFVVTTTADTVDADLGNGVCADSNGQCSLRAAIQTANMTVAADTITLPAGTYTITRLGTEDLSVNGDFDVLAGLTLQGVDDATTIIDAGGLDNAIQVPTLNGVEFDLYISDVTIRNASGASKIALSISSSGTLYLTDSTITDNSQGIVIYGDADIRRTTISGSTEEALFNGSNSTTLIKNSLITNNHIEGTFNEVVGNYGTMQMQDVLITGNTSTEDGGAIYNNDGVLTITTSTLSNNTASYGGAIYSTGSLASITLNKVTITDNQAYNEGGGMMNFQGDITLIDSVVSNNHADPFDGLTGNGGGIYNWTGSMTITHSTISGNTAAGTVSDGKGGGIYNDEGDLIIENTTISGNLAENSTSDSKGGGIYDGGVSLSLNNVTISNNTAEIGGGVSVYYFPTPGLTFANTIIAGNIAPDSPDCFNFDDNSMTSQGNNLIGNGQNCTFSASGDQINVNPLLAALADNGGFTQTHALQAGSPAINTGNAATCETTDQRHAARVGTCDKGAFESDGAAPTNTPVPSATPTVTHTPSTTPPPTFTPTFTPSATPVIIGELLTNGGFETGNPVPDGWTGTGLDNDKRVCDKPAQGKFFAHTGSCAFRFKLSTGISGSLSQKIIAPSTSVGNVLAISGWVNAKNLTGSHKIQVKIKYQDGTVAKTNVTIATGTYAYTNIGGISEPLTDAINNVTLKIKAGTGSGQMILDDFALSVAEGSAIFDFGLGSRSENTIPLP